MQGKYIKESANVARDYMKNVSPNMIAPPSILESN